MEVVGIWSLVTFAGGTPSISVQKAGEATAAVDGTMVLLQCENCRWKAGPSAAKAAPRNLSVLVEEGRLTMSYVIQAPTEPGELTLEFDSIQQGSLMLAKSDSKPKRPSSWSQRMLPSRFSKQSSASKQDGHSGTTVSSEQFEMLRHLGFARSYKALQVKPEKVVNTEADIEAMEALLEASKFGSLDGSC